MLKTLRGKTILVGALLGAIVAMTASSMSYFLTRQYVIRQRESSATTQVQAAARFALSGINAGSEPSEVLRLSSQLVPNLRAALFVDGNWYVSVVDITEDDFPESLKGQLSKGQAARQWTQVRDDNVVVVGYSLSTMPATWFLGMVPVQELRGTLDVVRLALLAGTALATLGAGAVAWWLSRRVMEPLHSMSTMATRIAEGDLSQRTVVPKEADLARLAQSFNDMTQTLESRIEREASLGALISHELRSPLTVIRGAVDLLALHQGKLDPAASHSVDILVNQVDSFERILNDLIEMSRYQFGQVTPVLETLSLKSLIETLAHRSGLSQDVVEVGNCLVIVDVPRFRHVFENLVRNAETYAGGVTRIRSTLTDENVSVHFDDAGPGVAMSERKDIFDMFFRGQSHSHIPGSGLGLNIAAEHMKVIGGSLTVGDSPNGGARFSAMLKRDVELS